MSHHDDEKLVDIKRWRGEPHEITPEGEDDFQNTEASSLFSVVDYELRVAC